MFMEGTLGIFGLGYVKGALGILGWGIESTVGIFGLEHGGYCGKFWAGVWKVPWNLLLGCATRGGGHYKMRDGDQDKFVKTPKSYVGMAPINFYH